MRLVHPTAERIDQGSIFNCTLVSGYENCRCFGIVLTARCDLAHEKHNVVNYLPVVEFNDWLSRDMCFVLAKRLHKSLKSKLHKSLIAKSVSNYLLETFPLKEIVLRQTSGQEQASLLKSVDQLKVIENALVLRGGYLSSFKELLSVDKDKSDGVVKDLIGHRLADFYFLDNVDVSSPSKAGYVVLLRRMQTIDCAIMDEIMRGIDFSTPAATDYNRHLSSEHEPLCMFTGILRSPDIEHLTQHYANLFIRIGLTDHSEEVIENHITLSRV